jgi:hypothetical protein
MTYEISIWLLPVLIAVTFHEAAHGFVAHLLGDDTAWWLGRVSFNPLKHIDPVGTISPLWPGLRFSAHTLLVPRLRCRRFAARRNTLAPLRLRMTRPCLVAKCFNGKMKCFNGKIMVTRKSHG